MSKCEILRYWLVYNGFEIGNELLVEENGTIYQIMIVTFGGFTALNDAELYTGKYELAENKNLYCKQFNAVFNRFERAISEIKRGDLIPEYRLKLFEEILTQLKEMRVKYDIN